MSTHTAIATTAKGTVAAVQVLTPAPGPLEVLVKVEYASMIAFDSYTTDLAYGVQSYPTTLGFNASGTIVQTGESVQNLAIGDRVR